MNLSKFSFFFRYYIKKHLLKNVTANDIFLKRFFRFAGKVPGRAIKRSEVEIVYNVENVNGNPLRVSIRGGTSSDVMVVSQVFYNKEYEPVVQEITKWQQQNKIAFIIDAGANAGYTTCYLKAFFPAATVVAIEPDSDNAKQIRKNFLQNNFSDLTLIEGGLWPKDSWLELKNDFRDGKDWSFYVVESNVETNLKGYSFDSLLKQFDRSTIDLLKIDIEGGEKELFSHPAMMDTVLQKTKFLAIEIHDETGIRDTIYEALKRNGFEWFNQGELTIATNKNIVQ